MASKKTAICFLCEKLYHELEDAEACERAHGLEHDAPTDNPDGYLARRTGPTRTREDVAVCYECGKDISDQPVYLDGRLFCSRACMDAWVRR